MKPTLKPGRYEGHKIIHFDTNSEYRNQATDGRAGEAWESPPPPLNKVSITSPWLTISSVPLLFVLT
jgi:hypothetical protein